jgi:hypothetical protein
MNNAVFSFCADIFLSEDLSRNSDRLQGKTQIEPARHGPEQRPIIVGGIERLLPAKNPEALAAPTKPTSKDE